MLERNRKRVNDHPDFAVRVLSFARNSIEAARSAQPIEAIIPDGSRGCVHSFVGEVARGARMRSNRKWLRTVAAFLCVALTSTTGCQTWFGGMTLPSPRYLEHFPQYFAPDPAF